jgi:hypothetical protein
MTRILCSPTFEAAVPCSHPVPRPQRSIGFDGKRNNPHARGAVGRDVRVLVEVMIEFSMSIRGLEVGTYQQDSRVGGDAVGNIQENKTVGVSFV